MRRWSAHLYRSMGNVSPTLPALHSSLLFPNLSAEGLWATRDREGRREAEQEGNGEGGEWMWPLPRLRGVFFPSVLIVILCHNCSTWEDSCLIICSHNNNRFSNLTNTDFWLKYAPLFLLLKHYNLLKLRNQLQYLSFFKTTVYVDILRKFSIYGKGQFNGMKFGA